MAIEIDRIEFCLYFLENKKNCCKEANNAIDIDNKNIKKILKKFNFNKKNKNGKEKMERKKEV